MDQIHKLNITYTDKIVVLELVKKLIAINIVEAVFLVGSIVKGNYKKNKSGIDLIVLIQEDSTEYMLIEEVSKKDMKFYKRDDIYVLDNTAICIHIQRYQTYLMYLESIITSEAPEIVQKDWTIGGVYREVILDDIANAIVLYDKKQLITKFSKKIKSIYQLGEKFGNSLKYQLKNKVNLTKKQYNEGNMILFHIGFWECLELIERLYCHKHKVYNQGFKHVIRQKEFLNEFNLTCFNNNTIKIWDMKDILEKIYEKYGGD